MSKSDPIEMSVSQVRIIAAIDALRAPAYALGATMAGFATIAREAGFDVWMTISTSVLVWGMPGQVAFASLFSAGSSLFIIFVNLLELSRVISEDSKSVFNFLYFSFLKYPSILNDILPFVTIISIAFLIRNLINNNEFVSDMFCTSMNIICMS